MGKHPKAPSKSGKAHFQPAQRVRACSTFLMAHREIKKVDPGPRLRVGKAFMPDDVFRRGHALFIAGEPSNSGAARTADLRQYKDTVCRWFQRWNSGGSCVRAGSRNCQLSQTEINMAVSIIGTPVRTQDSFRHWETIQEAIESDQGAQLRLVLQHKKVSCASLHKLLVTDLKLLTHRCADRRPELPPATLSSRRQAAEVWSAREPWLRSHGPTRSDQQTSHYFDWDYYFNYTFMIDAVSFEDGPSSGVKKAKNVYCVANTIWGPELQEPDNSIIKSCKLMYYVVVHPHGGIVCGPDLVFTGSKVPAAAATNKAQLLQQW